MSKVSLYNLEVQNELIAPGFPGGSTGPTGSTGSTGANFTGYDYEINVSGIDGNDTTGNGDLLTPVASITKALTLVSGQRRTIIIHPGTYTESPSITFQYTTLSGPGLIGGNIVIAGTVTTSVGCTISGLKITNMNITAPTATGNVNILNCDISGTLTKSSTADYTLIRFCDIGTTNITGSAGLVAIFGGNPNFITVNNAGAIVLVKNAVTIAPVLTAGNASFIDSIVYSTGSTADALTSAAGTIVNLGNNQFIVPISNTVARVALSGFYSIFNCVYDKPNSTLATTSGTGGTLNTIDYFQYINADKFITQGGTSGQYVKGDGSLDSTSPIGPTGSTGPTGDTIYQKILTNSSAINVFDVSVPTNTMTSGRWETSVTVTNGTDYQSNTSAGYYAVVSKAGVITNELKNEDDSKASALSSSSLSLTPALVSGANKITFTMTAASALTGTLTLTMYYTVKDFTGQTITNL